MSPSSTALSRSEGQLRRARADLEAALRGGRDLRVESLLTLYPAIADDPEAALELIYTEFVLREELGQSPRHEDWFTRFPQWKSDLEQMFDVHREIHREQALRQSRMSRDGKPADRPSSAGNPDSIPDYELASEVGRGGMGVVYRARQRSLNRTVALKVILSGAYAGERERIRFQREVESAARLDHPNIVRIYEVGEHHGRPYCAMEFLDGGNLADKLKGTPWPVRKAVSFVATLANAVQHAHERGIIHRDLKPANILLQVSSGGRVPAGSDAPRPSDPVQTPSPDDPVPKIADFGLVKLLDELDPESGASPTRTGDLVGTPAYMAPEQIHATGVTIGPATDVWALGVTFYEMLTGHLPFQGESTSETLDQVRTREPLPPRQIRPTLPRDVQTICLKCLHKNPAARYATAAALEADLRRWLNGEPILARPVGSVERFGRWCRRNPKVAALAGGLAVLSVIAAVSGTFAVINLEKSRRDANKVTALQREQYNREIEQRLQERRRVVQLLVSEGLRLVNQGDLAGGAVMLIEAMRQDPDEDNEPIHRTRIASLLEQCPTLRSSFRIPEDQCGSAVITADGQSIVTRNARNELMLWSAATGACRAIPRPTESIAEEETVSSNGRALVSRSGLTYHLRDTETGDPLPVPLPPGYGTLAPPYLPDGTARIHLSDGDQTLSALDPEGNPIGPPIRSASKITCWTIGESGELVATGSNDRTARVWTVRTGRPASPSLRHDAILKYVVLSPRDQVLATVGFDNTVQLWRLPSGEAMGHRIQHGTTVMAPVFAPAAPFLATAGWHYGIRLWNTVSGKAVGAPMADRSPTVAYGYSPSGQWLSVLDHERTARIWHMNSATPVTPVLYSGVRAQVRFGADDRTFTVAGADGSVRVWELPAEVPPRTVLHRNAQVFDAVWWADRTILSVGQDGLILANARTGGVRSTMPHRLAYLLAVSPKHPNLAVSVANDARVKVWDVETGRERFELEHDSRVLAARFAPDGRLATATAAGLLQFWDVTTGKPAVPPVSIGFAVHQIQFLNGDRALFASNFETRVVLWDLSAGREITTLTGLAEKPRLLVPPGRETFLLVSAEGVARRYRSTDGTPTGTPIALGEWRVQAALSPDGSLLAAVNVAARSVKVWDAVTGELRGGPFENAGGNTVGDTFEIALSPDNRRVALASSVLRIWDLASGQPISAPLHHLYRINSVSFSADGSEVLTASSDQTVRVWPIRRDDRPIDELANEARILARRQLDSQGRLIPLTPEDEAEAWTRLMDTRTRSPAPK